MGFLGGSVVKNCLPIQEKRVSSLDREDSLKTIWQLTPKFLPGKSHRHRTLAGYSPWGRKESDMTEHAHTNYFQDFLSLTFINVILGMWVSEFI